MIKRFIFFISPFLLLPTLLRAQNDSILNFKVALSGYVETYYLFDFALPNNNQRPNFYVSHNRHNEFNANIGMMRVTAENERVKTALGLMAGTYVNANMAQEPGVLKNIYEAHIAYKLLSNKNLWLQVGIFSSHIGFESAIGADCYTLSRSIAADNSPYYESGAKLNYKTKNERWDLSLMLLNGWQKIQRLNMNRKPSLGSQITYTYKSITINNSSYFGNEGTDAMPLWRYFHNFYVIKKVSSKSSFIIGVDLGLQHNSLKSFYAFWYSPQVVYRYSVSKKIDLATRVEHYSDEDAIITSPLKNGNFNVWGGSINLDYKIMSNVLFRIEYKHLYNYDQIFSFNAQPSNNNSSIAGAFAVKF